MQNVDYHNSFPGRLKMIFVLIRSNTDIMFVTFEIWQIIPMVMFKNLPIKYA